jgi:hypothetical protein
MTTSIGNSHFSKIFFSKHPNSRPRVKPGVKKVLYFNPGGVEY